MTFVWMSRLPSPRMFSLSATKATPALPRPSRTWSRSGPARAARARLGPDPRPSSASALCVHLRWRARPGFFLAVRILLTLSAVSYSSCASLAAYSPSTTPAASPSGAVPSETSGPFRSSGPTNSRIPITAAIRLGGSCTAPPGRRQRFEALPERNPERAPALPARFADAPPGSARHSPPNGAPREITQPACSATTAAVTSNRARISFLPQIYST